MHRLVGGVTGPPSGGGHAALADVATLGTPFGWTWGARFSIPQTTERSQRDLPVRVGTPVSVSQRVSSGIATPSST